MNQVGVISLLFLASIFICATAYPASQHDDHSSEVEFVPLEKRRYNTHAVADDSLDDEFGTFPIADDGFFGGGGSVFVNPFGNFYQNIEAMVARMRQRMSDLLNLHSGKVPASFGDVDLSKGNTTSETKIIDGHEVRINTTTYQKQGEHGVVSINVKTIDVRPTDDGEDNEEADTNTAAQRTTPRGKNAEPLADSVENEITKGRDGATIDEADIKASLPEKLTKV